MTQKFYTWETDCYFAPGQQCALPTPAANSFGNYGLYGSMFTITPDWTDIGVVTGIKFVVGYTPVFNSTLGILVGTTERGSEIHDNITVVSGVNEIDLGTSKESVFYVTVAKSGETNYQEGYGNRSYVEDTYYSYVEVTYEVNPDKPTATSPVSVGFQPLQPTLEAGAFSSSDPAASHAASEWQITDAEGDYTGEHLKFTSGEDAVNLTSITLSGASVLEAGTYTTAKTYFWRVRYKDNNGNWSDYSDEVSFNTDYAPGNNTILSPTEAETDIEQNPTITSDTFGDSDVSSGDYHKQTMWQIATDITFEHVVWDAEQEGEFLESVEVNSVNGNFQGELSGKTKLDYDTTYYVRNRYQDSMGVYSTYSTIVSFTVEKEPATNTARATIKPPVAGVFIGKGRMTC